MCWELLCEDKPFFLFLVSHVAVQDPLRYRCYLNLSSCACFLQIQLANSTAHRAAEQISDSLAQLTLVSSIREEVESDLGDDFQSLYRNNSLRLEEIRRINELLTELVSQAETFGEQANVNLTMAMNTATRAKNEGGQRKRQAQIARHNATNAHSDAVQVNSEAENALDTAMEFKVRLLT